MPKYIAVIGVDPKQLKRCREDQAEPHTESMASMIETEFGWLESSGIELLNLEEQKPVPDDIWGEHPVSLRSDWQHEVRNGDTQLGYWDWVDHQLVALEDDEKSPVDKETHAEAPRRVINYYQCPACCCEWDDEWDCACDDDCPQCGCRHVSPRKSEELE